VLQRIALVYLAAALAWLHLKARGRAALAVGLLAAYWAVMELVPVPGFGAGDLSPEGNLAFWLDHQLLGAHTWRYAPGAGDPEGILSTLPAIVTALAGLFVGELLRTRRTAREKLGYLLVWGAALAAAGLALQPLFPINKNLWSPTYVLFTAGAALLALGATYWLVDLRGDTAWARPFEIFGTNAIAAYVGSGLLAKLLLAVRWGEGAGGSVTLWSWLYGHLCAAYLPDYIASLAWALTHVAIWLAVMAALDRRGLHFRI
jgi:predicted acyltransferase